MELFRASKKTQWIAGTAIMLVLVQGPTSAQTGRNLLSGSRNTMDLQQLVLKAAEWHPFPRASERSAWLSIPATVRLGTIAQAENSLGAEWITPKASLFLDFVRNGNRQRYQVASFGRRERLATLVLAECMEGKGRFVDDIANGVWAICEESWWGAPAHLNLQKRGPGLPDVTEPTVDLFAAETGQLLAWTAYLLPEALDSVSPLLRERIRLEVRRRIIDPNLNREDFWWMGFTRTVNNWNPWICSNWLTTVLLLEDDPGNRAASIHKILVCLDNFLNPYPPDGGCDEGPSYWTRAGGSLFDCLELLHSASRGKIDLYSDELIRDIGRYVYKAYIDGGWYLNFADAPARFTPDASLIFRYGRAIGDSVMMEFAGFLARAQRFGEAAPHGQFGVLGRVLPALFHSNGILDVPAREPLIRDFWLPSIQVMGARSAGGTKRGFFLGAQGGHNAESHNHNDVGNFVVSCDGAPVLIDVGVETYTAKTFGKDRYTIWTMQSAYHNVPLINGVQQKDGRAFEARDVRYHADDGAASMSMDLSHAYPEEARCSRWERTLTLRRGDTILVTDRYELQDVPGPVVLTFMTPGPPSVQQGGGIALKSVTGVRTVLEYDRALLSANVDTIAVEDGQLRESWGSRLYRIRLVAARRSAQGTYTTLLRRE